LIKCLKDQEYNEEAPYSGLGMMTPLDLINKFNKVPSLVVAKAKMKGKKIDKNLVPHTPNRSSIFQITSIRLLLHSIPQKRL
jgi:hypothetical protein